MTMKSAAVMTVLGGILACGGGPGPSPRVGATASPAPGVSVTVGQQFTLHVGETAAIGGASAGVTFTSVASDSRCPSGVQCIQAGNAAVTLNVSTSGGAPRTVTLNTGTEPREAPLGSNVLRLVALAPAPPPGGTMEPSAYIATLCVCRQ